MPAFSFTKFMNRDEMLKRVRARNTPWDVVIVGGGATGIGCAVDAAARGLDVLLLERSDFGKGTSSRSTKLIHGGVRYLAKGDVSLVREALRERGLLKQNAPHLVTTQAFIVPCYSIWQKLYYGAGLKIYDLLSGNFSFGKSRIISKSETHKRLPNIKEKDLAGGVVYYDGQFDDARLLIDLAAAAAKNGATILNYAKVNSLTKNGDEMIDGAIFKCSETEETFRVDAKAVINATGSFVDRIRKLSDETSDSLISPSQGIHLVFDQTFLNSSEAIMIPKTSDGRVLFAIPWQGKTLVGTTDTPITEIVSEPKPLTDEIDFVLETCKNYLNKPPRRKDVRSVFVGIRPLVKSSSDSKNTASLSRDHTIEIDDSNLVTITGGKWTTYRNMAEDAVDKAIEIAGLSRKKCKTQTFRIDDSKPKRIKKILEEDETLSELIHPDFLYTLAEVVDAVRNEMARSAEDVLARRTRILFLDAKAAIDSVVKVASAIAHELGRDESWIDSEVRSFKKLAQNYLVAEP